MDQWGNEAAPPRQRPWLKWVLIALGVSVLGCVCVGAGLFYACESTVSSVKGGLEEAAAFEGQPIEACWDEALERGIACGTGMAIECRMRAQGLLTGCFQVAQVSDEFCAQRFDQTACAAECNERGATSGDRRQGCMATCGQLGTVLEQYCPRR